MGILEIFFLILIILSAIILTFFVMIQDDTGEGMGGIFGGASTTPFGSRAGNVLTRITTILAVVFFVSTISYAFIKRTPTDSADLLGKAREKQYENSATGLWFSSTENTTTGTSTDANPLFSTEATVNSAGTTSATTTTGIKVTGSDVKTESGGASAGTGTGKTN
jgi:preprotein translocase subunit SecG